MTKQQKLHRQAIKHLAALEEIIDELKSAGPCDLDGSNAILNVRERLLGLSQR